VKSPATSFRGLNKGNIVARYARHKSFRWRCGHYGDAWQLALSVTFDVDLAWSNQFIVVNIPKKLSLYIFLYFYLELYLYV
jgi:hypothetical protein